MADSDLVCSGLSAISGVGQSALSWTVVDPQPGRPSYLRYAKTEVYAASSNNRALAAKVGEGANSFIHAGVPPGATRYYWVRPLNTSGVPGDFHPLSASAGVASTAGTSQPGPGAITSTELATAAVTEPKMSNSAASTRVIADQAITQAKIAFLAVGTAQIDTAAITTAKIADAAITNAKIGSAAIGTANIQDAAITNAKIGTLSANKITFGTLSGITISAVTISGSVINGGTINSVTLNSANVVSGNISGVSITSTDFRTSTALPRIEMGFSVLQARNVSGSTVLQIGAFTTAKILTVDANISGDFVASFRNGSASAVQGQSPTFAFYASTGAYGPFTASHEILWPIDLPLPAPGDLVMDDGVVFRKDLSNTICQGKPSERGRPALGVFVCDMEMMRAAAMPEDMSDDDLAAVAAAYRLVLVNAVGEGQMNVCDENGAIEAGDLLTPSSTPGKAMRQSDDLLRASTVARAREGVVCANGERTQIAVIYMGG